MKISDKVSSNSVSRNVNNKSNNSVQMCKNKRKNGLRSSDVNNKNRFSENTKNHEKMIKFIYTNIRSIKTKFDDFRTLVNTENPNIIGLTETWLNCTKNEFECEFNLEGYTMLNKDRKNKSILD